MKIVAALQQLPQRRLRAILDYLESRLLWNMGVQDSSSTDVI